MDAINAIPVTLRAHLDAYLEHKRARRYSEKTVISMRNKIARFLLWLQRYNIQTPDQLRREHLEHWQKHLASWQTEKGTPLKAWTINGYLNIVRCWLRYLVQQGYVVNHLPEVLLSVKEPQLLVGSVLTHVEMKRLLSKVNTTTSEGFRNRTMLELLYSSGIRISELLGLDVDDVDLRQGMAKVLGKGNKERMVPIGKTALRYLESYLVAVRPFLLKDRTERALFTSCGHRMGYQVFCHMLHGVVKMAKLEKHVSPHTFRRSCTTELIRGGANMYHVKELLGHESLDTLKHYAKLTILDLKKTHEKCHPRERDPLA